MKRILLVLGLLVLPASVPAQAPASPKLSPTVTVAALTGRPVDVLVVPAQSVKLAPATLPRQRGERLAEAHRSLRGAATRAQAGIVQELTRRGIAYRPFWLGNVVQARVDAETLDALASRSDVAYIMANPVVRMQRPVPAPMSARSALPAHAKTVQQNISLTGAPTLWAQGARGQGIVIAGADTGVRWNHPALLNTYRGYTGSALVADHAYNWHDAIHAQVHPIDTDNPCGYNVAVACDDDTHGSHTMGTMVGDDLADRQIGMAPGARWIACRNMDQGWGSPATYIECFQWFMAPTDAAGANPDPARAPHVINNSWSCIPAEGCDAANIMLLRNVVQTVRNAGILVVASAGNSGPACETVSGPPSMFPESFVVAASANAGAIADFSSRGPVAGTALLKPDITAPGVGVVSSVFSFTSGNNGYTAFNGTSMAGPHVAGAAALLMSAAPDAIGDPAALEQALREGAAPRTTSETCGGIAAGVVPNATYGYGFLDVLAARDVLQAGQLLRDGFE